MFVKTIEYNQPISDDYTQSRFLVHLDVSDEMDYRIQYINLYWMKPGVISVCNEGDFSAKIRCPSGRTIELPPDNILTVDNPDDRASFEITVTECR